MPTSFFLDQFVDAIDQCRRLCVDQIVECYVAAPSRLAMASDDFFAEVQHRFNCLVIKPFVETAESDLVLTPAEAELAKVLVEHLLNEHVRPNRLQENFQDLATIAMQTAWVTALEPLKWFEQTQDYFEEIKSGILRIASIASKVDGHARGETIAQLKMIRMQLDQHLPLARTLDVAPDRSSTDQESVPGEKSHQISQALIKLLDHNRDIQKKTTSKHAAQVDDFDAAADTEPAIELTSDQRDELLREGMEELSGLIGIEEIRHEVQALINVCKLQQYRSAHSMPVNSVSLHMVFSGNPGTEKTTVARIAAKLFGAIGVIKRGHLIETDRI